MLLQNQDRQAELSLLRRVFCLDQSPWDVVSDLSLPRSIVLADIRKVHTVLTLSEDKTFHWTIIKEVLDQVQSNSCLYVIPSGGWSDKSNSPEIGCLAALLSGESGRCIDLINPRRRGPSVHRNGTEIGKCIQMQMVAGLDSWGNC